MSRGRQKSQVVHDILESIHYIYDESELAETVLTAVSKGLNAEAGSIFKVRPDGSLYALASYGVSVQRLKRIQIKPGQGIAGWVAQYAQPAKSDDVAADPRFARSVDTVTGFKTRSVIAAPILTRGKPTGVIEFVNRRDGPFGAQDLEDISKVGREIGIAFENVRLVRTLEQTVAFQESLLKSLSAGVLVLDKDLRLLSMNPSAERILSIDYKAGAEPPHVNKVIGPHGPMLTVLKDVSEADDPIIRREIRLVIHGQYTIIGYSGVPIYGKDGSRLGSALLFQDITPFVTQLA